MAELREKEPLMGPNKERGHGYEGSLERGSRSPGLGNGDAVESDLSENGSRASSMKSGKSECPTVQDLDAEIQNVPEPRPNEGLHQRQNHQEVQPQQQQQQGIQFKQDCCLQCCTRKLLNNRKKCSAVAFFFAILFLAGSIACLVLVAKYPEVLTDPNDNITLYIPPKSAVKFNLTDYNISTIKRDQLTIAAASNAGKEHKGLVTIAATHTRKECTDVDKIITKKTYEYNKTETKSILRYWPSSSHVSVNISIQPKHDHHITAWKWGTLSNLPPDVSCKAIRPESTIMDGTINKRNIDDKSIFFDKKPKKNNHMIRITFCNKHPDITTTATIEIEECVALPKRALCKYIYIDDSITEEPNPVEVQFQSFFSEMLKHSMLYIDTRHMSSSSDEADKELQLELQPQNSGSNPLKEIVIAITIILFIASILFFSLGFFCLCCCRRKEFCGCGVYYQNKRV